MVSLEDIAIFLNREKKTGQEKIQQLERAKKD